MISSDKKVNRIAADAVLLCIALMLSYIETLLPHIPLPGFKLGLANIALTVAAYVYSVRDAFMISLCRIAITFFLFGSVTSLIFSLTGAVFSVSVLALLVKKNRIFSFIGISVLCAAAHNTGQFAASLVIFGNAVIAYIPMLLLSSVLCGLFCGIILCLLPLRLLAKRQ